MLVIHMGVDPEKPLEDGLGVCEEIIWEGDSDLAWEEGLIVQLILDPSHQEVDVLGGGALDWLLHLVAICPVILQETKSFLTKLAIPLSPSPPYQIKSRTSYLGPADMTGQDCSVQNSVIVPYSMLIWLKKSTVFTATHSLRSSPSGSITANRRLPEKRNSPLQNKYV